MKCTDCKIKDLIKEKGEAGERCEDCAGLIENSIMPCGNPDLFPNGE